MKRVTSLLLALLMILSLLPVSVWAETEIDSSDTEITTETEEYDPFAALENAEAKTFAEEFLLLFKGNSDDTPVYILMIKGSDVTEDEKFADTVSFEAYREAEIAYFALSEEAYTALNNIPLLIGENPDGSLRVQDLMDTYAWVYANTYPYYAFDGLTSDEAHAFAQKYLMSETFLENGVRWEVAGVANTGRENGVFVSTSAYLSAQAALNAYDALDTAVRTELDAVVIHDGPVGDFFFDDTFAAYMEELRNCYQNTIDPYLPFAKLSNSDAIAYVNNYVDYNRVKNDNGEYEYWIELRGVWTNERGMLSDPNCLAQAKKALDAYDALSDAAKEDLNTAELYILNGDPFTFSQMIQDRRDEYENTVNPYLPFDGLTNQEALTFVEDYVVYGRGHDDEGEYNYWVDLKDVWAEDGSFCTDRAKAALDAYDALSDEAKAALDDVKLYDGREDVIKFSDMIQWRRNDYESALNPYLPFEELTNQEALTFVEEYVDYGRGRDDEGEFYWVSIRDLWGENDSFHTEQAEAALDAYDSLSDEAKAALDALKLRNGHTEVINFSDVIRWCRDDYDNAINPYRPFVNLTNEDALAFVNEYIDYNRWKNEKGEYEYWAGLKNIWTEENELRIDRAGSALNAYAALPAGARSALNAIVLRRWDNSVTVSHIMLECSRDYMGALSDVTFGTVTSLSQLGSKARSFIGRYMVYDSSNSNRNIDVIGVEYAYGNYTDAARQAVLAACTNYSALSLSVKRELEKLYVVYYSKIISFSELMQRLCYQATEPVTGTVTDPGQLGNATAEQFLAGYIDYDPVTHTVAIKGTKYTADKRLFTPETLTIAEEALEKWRSITGNGDVWGALNVLNVCFEGTPVRFNGLMEEFWRMVDDTKCSGEYGMYLFKNADFVAPTQGDAPGNFNVSFPDGLVRYEDYDYSYENGMLTVTIKPGNKAHWQEAYQQVSDDMAGNIYFNLTFHAPDGATKVTHDCGMGVADGGVWRSYLDKTEYKTAWSLHDGENAIYNGRPIAAANRDDDTITITAASNGDEVMAVSWFKDAENNDGTEGSASEGENLGRFVLGIRVKFEELFNYEFNTPTIAAVPQERISTTVDGDANWNVTKSDGQLDLRPVGETISERLNDNENTPVTTVTLTPPDEGYAINWEKSVVRDGCYGSDGNTFQLFAFGCSPTTTYYTIVWSKDGAADITETLTARIAECRSFMADIVSSNDQKSKAATEEEVGTPPNGMTVTYDESLGYFHTSFTPGTLPSVEDLQKGITLTPPENAVKFRFVDFGGNRDYAYTSQNECERWKESLSRSSVFDLSDSDAQRHLTIPYVKTDSIRLDGVTIYFASTQLYNARIVEWLDSNGNSLGYTYVYGKNDSFVNSVASQSATTVTDAVETPLIISDNDLTLTCKRYPQTGDDRTQYMRLMVDDESKLNAGGNEIYLPYSYFPGLTWVQVENQKNIKPIIRHYVNGENAEPEILEGEYTPYGIKFTTSSFSPFTVTWRTEYLSGRPTGGAKVSVLDMAFTYDYLTGQTEQPIEAGSDQWYAMDVNGDETVDVYDLQTIYEMASGLRQY